MFHHPAASCMAAAVAVVLCFCTVIVSGSHVYNHQAPNLDNLVGTLCEPPFGFLPLTCGDYEVIESRSERAPIYKYGPNTCRTTRVVRRNVREYRYRRYCDWVYSHYYYNWVQSCSLVCQPTNECTDRNQTSDFSRFECCEGYQTRGADKKDHYNYYFQTYYRPVPALPVGCPRAVGNSLAECLIRQNLTEFMNYLIRSSYFDLLIRNDSNIPITVFAPTNAAFDAVRGDLVGVDPDMLIGNHIVNGTVKESDLILDRRFTNVAGLTLHSTVASFPDTSQISSYSQQFISVRFINGARIVNRDSCITTNGTLHIIDRVLMPGNLTIAQILSMTPEFSRYRDAAEAVGTLPFLMEPDVSRTLFVPTNDVFDEAIPEDLLNCLTAYMRLPLQDLVLHHIAGKTDYDSTLSLQGFIHTLQLSPILVTTDSDGNISLSRDMAVQITVSNIPASNGVIHVINGVLMPSGFNFGKCQEFVPTTPPPTTPPPTTPPPTTPPSTTIPDTTAPVMVTDAPGTGGGSSGNFAIDKDDVIDYEANP